MNLSLLIIVRMDEDQFINGEDDPGNNPEMEQSDDPNEEPSSPSRSKKTQQSRKIILNVSLTKYSVVKKAGRSLNYKLLKKEDEDNWDVFWTDSGVQPEKLSKMKPFQKINHFPGMYSIARKNNLAKNLNRLHKVYPKDYNFFPKTWLIPAEFSDLVLQFDSKKSKKSKNKVFIVKPEASCQGRGIFLTKKLEDLSLDDRYVVQEYLQRPFLIDGLKFDLRIYVLVAGCDPLRIFLYQEGLARFATEPYIKPKNTNLSKVCMHLTNYAINKNSENFIFNDDCAEDDKGHKRSLTSTMNLLSSLGHDTEKLWEKIRDLIIKTLCAVQPTLAHTYKACQPDDPFNGMCFEILGFDVILDSKLKPWLLEVNHSPSFTTDSPLDLKIKFDLISETFTLLNIRPENRSIYTNKQKKEIFERSVSKSLPKNKDRKVNEFISAQEKRNKWEERHLGNFVKIFENGNLEKYQKFILTANEVWEEWTGGKAKTKRVDKKKNNSKEEEIKKIVSVRQSRVGPGVGVGAGSGSGQGIGEVSKSGSVFERLSKKSSKISSIVDQPAFPGVRFDGDSGQVPILPYFLEMMAGTRGDVKVSKVFRVNEYQVKSGKEKEKNEKLRYPDLPILIQSMIGNSTAKGVLSNDKLPIKSRNMTPAYRKKPYQYVSNLSYYKKWEVNE